MKKYIFASVGLLAIIAIIGISTMNTNAAEEKNNQVLNISSVSKVVKDKLIDFTYMENGKEKSFSDLAKGKVVFLNFWGTWCPPCRAEIPDIIKINKELKGKDILIVGIALEKQNTKDKNATVSNFHTKNNMNYINFVDNDLELSSAYGGMKYVPTTLMINKNGDIVEVIQGMRSYDEFMKSINKIL